LEIPLNWLDWAIVSLLALSTLLGLMSGLVASGLRLLVVILSFVVSLRVGGEASQALALHLPEAWMADLGGYLGAFLIALLIGGLVVEILRKLVRHAGLGGFDRMGGMAFGFLRGYALLAAFFFALSYTPVLESRAVGESKAAPAVLAGSEWLATSFGGDIERARSLLEREGEKVLRQEAAGVGEEPAQPEQAAPEADGARAPPVED